jgi:hypothetical protein
VDRCKFIARKAAEVDMTFVLAKTYEQWLDFEDRLRDLQASPGVDAHFRAWRRGRVPGGVEVWVRPENGRGYRRSGEDTLVYRVQSAAEKVLPAGTLCDVYTLSRVAPTLWNMDATPEELHCAAWFFPDVIRIHPALQVLMLEDLEKYDMIMDVCRV